MRTITKKIPGGKLLRLKAGLENGKLAAPQLSGDFFLIPGEKITALEEALEGVPVSESDTLKELLEYVVEREGITMSGIAIEDIVAAVRELQ